MRIALVSPYSWTYPGGVTRHIEALAEQLLASGHHVRVLAPFDPPDARSERLHRGARPQDRELPGLRHPARPHGRDPGQRRGLEPRPHAVRRAALRRELEAGDFDVVNVHEPVAPSVSWDALAFGDAALVGTFHTYGTNAVTHGAARAMGAGRRMRNLHGRIAVSEAAAWTARRFFGGRYEIVPNGVEVPPSRSAEHRRRRRARCGSRSSARRSSARACRCCCARSRGCASTSTPSSRSSAPCPRRSSRCCSTIAASRSWAASTTRRSPACCARPTCSARRRSAARASAWS